MHSSLPLSVGGEDRRQKGASQDDVNDTQSYGNDNDKEFNSVSLTAECVYLDGQNHDGLGFILNRWL
jgi:hypothetical protein